MDKNKTKHVIALSINPIYAHAILSGEKTVEFRRNGVPTNIKKIVIYSTKPDQKLIGYCSVKRCIVDNPEILWQNFGNYGRINKHDFLSYYKGYEVGKCYILKSPRSFKLPLALGKCKTFSTSPQSFVYLDKNEWRNLRRKKKKPTSKFIGPKKSGR